MKVLIISDSHGLKEELFEILDRHEADVDLIIHCGDSELPKQSFAAYDKLLIVGGNCDYDRHYQEEIFFQQDKINIFVTHGHLHNVKMSLVKLSYRSEELGANLVCFGHSHVADSFAQNNVLYINPGSIRLPKNRTERTYAIVEFITSDNGEVLFFDHTGQEIPDLKKGFRFV